LPERLLGRFSVGELHRLKSIFPFASKEFSLSVAEDFAKRVKEASKEIAEAEQAQDPGSAPKVVSVEPPAKALDGAKRRQMPGRKKKFRVGKNGPTSPTA
jgi:hypothetical protein